VKFCYKSNISFHSSFVFFASYLLLMSSKQKPMLMEMACTFLTNRNILHKKSNKLISRQTVSDKRSVLFIHRKTLTPSQIHHLISYDQFLCTNLSVIKLHSGHYNMTRDETRKNTHHGSSQKKILSQIFSWTSQ